jgi:hypothetical protein
MLTGYIVYSILKKVQWYWKKKVFIVGDKNIFGVLLGCETYMRDRRIYKMLWKEREEM